MYSFKCYLFGTGGNIINEFEDKQEESEVLTFDKILKHFMKENFSSVKDEVQENTNSFKIPGKSSLNLLMAYLLSNNKYETSYPANEEEERKAAEKINQLVHEKEKDFQEIISLLKNMT
ncbi:hypothetical protein MHH37_18945 [Solibacillus sp. FSL K6-1781]|uniref:hypothetical protein n=1 Tax=Solibacillus sp. FSL K6-1781 TaxID=2921474 RepID=UPI00315AE413